MSLMLALRRAIVAGLLLAGCSASGGPGDSATRPDGAATQVQCTADVMCGSGNTCCSANGSCYDAARNPGACPAAAPINDPGIPGAVACNSNAQCPPSQFCTGSLNTCVGSGFCTDRANCPTCDAGDCAVCGCDGTTYANQCTAMRAGIRSVQGACGVGPAVHESDGAMRVRIGCGSNPSFCPAGLACCAITGLCFPADDPAFCAPLSAEGSYCRDNLDCLDSEICAATSCAGSGRCAPSATPGGCNGTDPAPVCGCDGRTYVNGCGARAARTRVLHAGNCP